MPFDDRKNLAISNVVTPPSPAASGTSGLVMTTGHGSRFSATPPYNLIVGPANVVLTPANAEIIRVTAISGDTLTAFTRAQEGTTARTITVGDVIYQGPTDKTFDDIEAEFGTSFPVGTAAYATYTPTLTQNATVNKTVTYARYMKVGRMVSGRVEMVCTSAGTAANGVIIGLPVAALANGTTLTCIGSGAIYDSSANAYYQGSLMIATGSATTTWILPGGGGSAALGGGQFTAALATNDVVSISFSYEAAS